MESPEKTPTSEESQPNTATLAAAALAVGLVICVGFLISASSKSAGLALANAELATALEAEKASSGKAKESALRVLKEVQDEASNAKATAESLRKELESAREVVAAPIKERAAMSGTWRCQTVSPGSPQLFTTLPTAIRLQLDIILPLPISALGSFVETHNNEAVDNIRGRWSIAGSYLVIERENGGYGSFKIASRTDAHLTLISRTGQILEFTRLK